MPITLSAKKKMHQDQKRHALNLRVMNTVKKAVRIARKSPLEKNVKLAYSAIDTAVKKKLMNKNTSARLKSRLTKKQNKAKK